MGIFRALIVATALVASAGIAEAQTGAPSVQQYEAVMTWATRHQAITQDAVTPLQHMPDGYAEGSDAERARWVSVARAWAVSFASAIQTARQRITQLGPVPEAGELTTLYQRQAEALPQFLDAMQDFVVNYNEGIAAIERNDPHATAIANLNTIDANILIQTQFRNLNALQSESIGDGPQRYLLRSFASSYDALISIMHARRAIVVGEDITRASAPAVRSAAETMRQSARIGRARALSEGPMTVASLPPEQSEFASRVQRAYDSFERSFAREEQIAALLDRIAAGLEAGFFGEEVQPDLTEIGRLDFERGNDLRYRAELIRSIGGPT